MGISEAVYLEINRSFNSADADEVITTLSDAPDAFASSERIQFAILKLARGNLQDFDKAFGLACSDWRDVLVAAGMASMDWPDVVVSEGLADEEWRKSFASAPPTSTDTKKKQRNKPWWQFW